MQYLVDTNVLSELAKPRPVESVVRFMGARSVGEIAISVLTLGEIEEGVFLLEAQKHQRGPQLRGWFESILRDYRKCTLRVTTKVAREWARINAREPQQADHPVDTLLAATAIVHDLTLVTRNVRHIERTGCKWLNPFAE